MRRSRCKGCKWERSQCEWCYQSDITHRISQDTRTYGVTSYYPSLTKDSYSEEHWLLVQAGHDVFKD